MAGIGDEDERQESAENRAVLRVEFGIFSECGRRDENQDFTEVRAPKGLDLETRGIVAAVADGHFRNVRVGHRSPVHLVVPVQGMEIRLVARLVQNPIAAPAALAVLLRIAAFPIVLVVQVELEVGPGPALLGQVLDERRRDLSIGLVNGDDLSHLTVVLLELLVLAKVHHGEI